MLLSASDMFNDVSCMKLVNWKSWSHGIYTYICIYYIFKDIYTLRDTNIISHIPPNGKRKIIDSKVQKSRGNVSSLEAIYMCIYVYVCNMYIPYLRICGCTPLPFWTPYLTIFVESMAILCDSMKKRPANGFYKVGPY